MTTITWAGTSGNWGTPALWLGGVVPTAADIAVIGSATSAGTIILNGAESVGGVVLDGTNAVLDLTGTLDLNGQAFNAQAGTLNVTGTLENGVLNLGGATVAWPALDPVTSQVAAPELNLVAVKGSLDLSLASTTLQVVGLAQPGFLGIKIGAGSELLILDEEDFQGQTIDLAGGVLSDDDADPNNGSIFFGPGTEVLQDVPNTTARVGPDVVSSLFGLGSVTNEGTIIASAGTLILDSQGGAFDSIFKLGPFINAGTIEIGAGATVVDDTNGNLAGLGTILNSGGSLDLRGTLTNTNTTIDVAPAGTFADLQLDNTVIGGTILEDGGSLSFGTESLQDVTVVGTGATFDTLTIGQNTVFNPGGGPFVLTAQQAAYGQIMLNNGAVLTNAAIAYGGTQYQINISVGGDGTAADGTPLSGIVPSATLGSTTTLDVGAGQVLRLDAGTDGTLVNNAVINVAAGGQLDFVNAATYVAGGTINVVPGSTVQFTGNIGLNAITNVAGTGALLTNLGNLDLGGGTISTSGNANFSKFENGGQITDGTVITNSTENPNLGVIYNATLVLTGGVTPVNSLSVNDATIQGALQLTANGEIDVYGNLNLENQAGTGPGVLILDQQPVIFVQGAATSVQFKQTVTVSNATVLLSGVTPATESGAFNAMSDLEVQGGQTVTLAPSVLIVATTVNGPIGILGGPGFFVNEGTIAVIPGADLVVGPYGPTPFGSATLEDFINKGLITIAAGGTLDVATQSSILALGSIVGPGGLVRLDAPDSGSNNYDNTGNTLTVGGPTGAPDLLINSTTLTGGTIVNAGGAFTALSGVLNNVSYVGALDLTSGTDLYGNTAQGFLSFDGGTLDSQSVTLPGGTLLLGADQSFTGATLSLAGEFGDTGHTLSFDANTSVNVTGGLYMPVGHLLNAGTITIGPGGSLQLSDFSAGTPEPSESGTIIVNNGAFFTNVLDSGQTLDLGSNSTVSVSRFDPGSQVVFQAPNTISINQGVVTDGSFVNFGVGDTIALTGYEDGPFAQLIFGNNGIPHGADPTITLGYDGQTLDIIRGGTATIAALTVGAGYDVNGFTVTQVGDPTVLVSGYNVTYAPPGQPVPVGPSISGTQANQATNDLTSVAPLTNVVLSDPNVGMVITAQVSFPTYTGTLTATAGGTLTGGGGIWLDTGSPAAVQAALRGLVYTPTPHSTEPGSALNPGFTITVNDQFASVTDSTTSVRATAVEDPILISGVIPLEYASDNSGGAQPFNIIALSDPDDTQFTATATLSSTSNASFGHSYNATISPAGVYSTSGSLSTVQTALRNLIIYTSSLGVPTGQTATATVTMSISDHVSNTASATSTVVIVASGTADAAGLDFIGATPGQATTDQIAIDPFANAILTDKQVGAQDTLTITMSNPANGVFSDVLGGVTNGSTFTATGTVDSVGFVDAIDNALAGLVFTPTRGQVPFGQSVMTTFSVVANNSFGTATDASASVIATAAGAALTISGAQADQELADNGDALPLAGVTIQDSQIVPVDTATATLSNPSSGVLLAGNGGTVGLDGVFRVSGSLAAVQSALQAVEFEPATAPAGHMVTTGVTIGVADGSLTATDTTTSLFVIGNGAAGSIIANSPPTAGLSSSGPALTPGTSGSNTFFLNLGTVSAGSAPLTVTLTAQNLALSPADTLVDTFVLANTTGFTNGGFTGGTTLGAGGSAIVGTVTLNTAQVGVPFETVTLTPADANTSQILPIQTVTISGLVTAAVVVSPPAIEVLNSAGTIAFPNARVGAVEQQAISLSNGATAPAGTLTVTPAVAGQATASGSVSGLTAGGTDATDIVVGVDTSAAGARQGSVTLNASSVNSGGTATALSNPAVVAVSGDVYRPAIGTIAPVSAILHVGDSGVLSLPAGNIAANDGFSEALIAAITTVSEAVNAVSSGPSGDILPGATSAAGLAIGVPTTVAGIETGTVTVALTSDGGTGSGSIDGLGTTALTSQAVPVSVTVDNYANPMFEDVSGAGTFTAGATAYTLDLGTITQGTGPFAVDFGVLNSTTGPSDVLTGSLSAIGSSAFTNSGLAAIGTLAAGQSDIAPEITLATDTTGTFGETITLTGTGSNPGGFSAALPAETLTVTGTVAAGPGTVTVPPIPPAIATVLTPTPIDFGNAHVLDGRFQSLDIGNTATTGAAALDVSLPSVEGEASASGDANASGDYISGLAAGGADSSIDVGIVGTVAGAGSGTITLGLVSDAGTLGTTALPSQNITVLGTFYREAAAALLPLNAIVHVGDPGTISLPVGNSDPADGFSENLIAMLIGTTGSLGIAAAGPTDEIAAGQTNTNALALSFATTQAGTVSGTATVGLTSDGGTGIGSIDGLGQTTLTADTVPVSIVVDHYATPVLTSDGSLTSSGPDSYVLNLGTATQGAAVLSADLNLGNSATGPADWLDGNFNATGSGQFNNALSPVTDITAGTSADAGTVSLSTNQTGVFSETIMLSPTDANADGFSDALTARNITVTGTVVAPIGTTEGDVHMVTYDGLRYDFQAVGDYVLSRSTEPGDTFQIQIETAAAPSLGAVSITTEVAAQVGSDVVTFGLGQVEVDGAADTGLNAGDPVQDLAFGQLQQLSSSEFRLTWANGEALTVTDAGPYLNTSVSLPATDAPGSVQGLLGGDSGQASDFQLADGTVLRQPLSNSEILGAFASAWRGNSLLVGVSPMQFIYTDGTSGQTVTQATASGQVLSAAPGMNVLSDTGGFGVTFLGTLSELANETITGFSAKDVIDVSGLNSATANASYAGGVLTVSDGARSGGISLSGQVDGGFKVTSDQHGGAFITIS